MRNILEIIIRPEGVTVCNPSPNGEDEYISSQDSALDERLARFCATHEISTASAVLYISEELLFFKTFELPLGTPNLNDAIKFQLGLLTPFSSDALLYSYSTTRKKKAYKISLYATPNQSIQSYLQKINAAGFTIVGLFPESQRHVNRTFRKIRWALLMPGRFSKAMVFSGTHMEDRFLCSSEPDFSDLATTCDTEVIYHVQPPEGSKFLEASQLLENPPLLKEFDLLPFTYKKPDFSKGIIAALIILNILAFAGLTGLKQYRLTNLDQQVTREINEIMPKVREINQLTVREQELAADIETVKTLSNNPDLIKFLQRLTEELPTSSFLDQLRLDKNSNAIHIQGYTEDVGELTTQLQKLGQTKLKSTSRRRNETYFQMEVSLP